MLGGRTSKMMDPWPGFDVDLANGEVKDMAGLLSSAMIEHLRVDRESIMIE